MNNAVYYEDRPSMMNWDGRGVVQSGNSRPSTLPQKLSNQVPYGSLWVVEAQDICGVKSIMYAGEAAPTLSSKTTFSSFGSLGSSVDLTFADATLRAYLEAKEKAQEFSFWGLRGCTDAGFTVTYWDYDAAKQTDPWNVFDATILSGSNPRFATARTCLQEWLGVSVDELADLLRLSPTTVVNLTKPGRVVRPKTVRKMMVVYGLLNELLKVMGDSFALTWARTVGYRLLSEGNLRDFEQYVSTHIFPTSEKHAKASHLFGDDSAELEITPRASIGRPSRI